MTSVWQLYTVGVNGETSDYGVYASKAGATRAGALMVKECLVEPEYLQGIPRTLTEEALQAFQREDYEGVISRWNQLSARGRLPLFCIWVEETELHP